MAENKSKTTESMLRPAVSQILRHNESPYSLVVAVAKRAREITEAEGQKKPSDDKPVTVAVNDFYTGKVTLIEPAHIGQDIEE